MAGSGDRGLRAHAFHKNGSGSTRARNQHTECFNSGRKQTQRGSFRPRPQWSHPSAESPLCWNSLCNPALARACWSVAPNSSCDAEMGKRPKFQPKVTVCPIPWHILIQVVLSCCSGSFPFHWFLTRLHGGLHFAALCTHRKDLAKTSVGKKSVRLLTISQMCTGIVGWPATLRGAHTFIPLETFTEIEVNKTYAETQQWYWKTFSCNFPRHRSMRNTDKHEA